MATSSSLDRVKIWAFPGLISVLAAIIWNDVKEIKADVKELIAQSAEDKARIENLERIIYNKESAKNTSNPTRPGKESQVYFTEFIIPKEDEEFFATR